LWFQREGKGNLDDEEEEGHELTEEIESCGGLKTCVQIPNENLNKYSCQQNQSSKATAPVPVDPVVILEQKTGKKTSYKLESFEEEPENYPETNPIPPPPPSPNVTSQIPFSHESFTSGSRSQAPLVQTASTTSEPSRPHAPLTGSSSVTLPGTSNPNISSSSPAVTTTSASGGNTRTNSLRRRKISATTSAKLSLETPILRVIHLLSDAQSSCPASVMEVIEEALEILRSPDLYTPLVPTAHSSSSSVMGHSHDRQSISYPGNTLPISSSDIHTANSTSSSSSISTVKGSNTSHKRQESDADEVTTDLFTGLIHSNKPISGIRRMSYEAAVANRQSFSSLRDFSPLSTTSSSVCSSSVQQLQQPIPSLTNVPDNIKELLDNQLTWDFDVIRLEQVSVKKPLVWLGLSILSHFNVCSTLNCDEVTLRNWLTLIESNYRDNPYHNSTHAADVMQATAFYLTKPRLDAIFDPLDEAISLIAAICHDLDHPGKTSAFLCNSGSELAILYNDISVLESHHAALTFKLTLSDPKVNIFRNLDKETFKEVRHSVVDMILATEMTKHFEHLTKFVNVFNKSLSIDEGSPVEVSDKTSRESPSAREARIRSSSLASPENVVLVKRILIKCADVSNPTRPLHLCVSWGHRIAEEYCNQTDEEKAQGLPVVMPVFDRSTCSIPKSQVSLFSLLGLSSCLQTIFLSLSLLELVLSSMSLFIAFTDH